MDFTITRFGDFAVFKYGKMPKKSDIKEDGKYPIYSGYRYVGYYDEYNTEANQLVIVARGVGGTGDVKITKEKCYLTNLSIGAQIDESIALPQYLYYYFSMRNLRYLDSGSAQSQITISDLEKVEIPLPNIESQIRIVACLSMFDHKIRTNEVINNNLKQQAQAIYQQMFIENRNANWKEGKLSDLVAVKYGKDHKKLDDGCYPVYGSGGIMRYVEKPLYTGESVLIPRKGTLNNVMYVNGAFWSVDTMFYTEMLRPNIAKFVYHFVKGKDLASLNAGSAVPSMTTNILNAMQLYIPDDETLCIFEETVKPMYAQIQENEKQSVNLAKLRDTLLPRLMSGELDVSDIDL